MKTIFILASVLFTVYATPYSYEEEFEDVLRQYMNDDPSSVSTMITPTASTPYPQESTPVVPMKKLPSKPFKPNFVPVEKGFLRRLLKKLFDDQRRHDKEIKAIFKKLTVTKKELKRIQDEFEKAEKAGKVNNW